MITINKSLAFRIGLHAAILHAHFLSIASEEKEIRGTIKEWQQELKFLHILDIKEAMWKLLKVGLMQRDEDGRCFIYE